jgi:hypothetical protein
VVLLEKDVEDVEAEGFVRPKTSRIVNYATSAPEDDERVVIKTLVVWRDIVMLCFMASACLSANYWTPSF